MSKVEDITAGIIADIEAGNLPAWRKPWSAGAGMPRNAKSGRAYRGLNVWWLLMAGRAKGYTDPRWLTFKQAREAGGSVRKGERGTLVAFFQPPIRPDDEHPEGRPPFWTTYTVFNVEQTDGCNIKPLDTATKDHDPIEAAEAIIAGMPNPPRFIENPGAQASYTPVLDVIETALLRDFDTADDFYATKFHEMGHATGAEHRLGRDGVNERQHFGSDKYGREELVAEMTSALLAGECGLSAATVENSEAYLAAWLRTLRAEPRILLTAAAQAQRAADYILDRTPTTA